MSATERFGIKLAPNALSVVQELINTKSAFAGTEPDLLATVRSAQAWWDSIAARPEPAARVPKTRIRGADLSELRSAREALAGAVARLAPIPGAQSPSATSTLTLRPDGSIAVNASQGGAATVIGAALLGLLLEEGRPERARLKLCPNPACQVAFWDFTKPNNGVWHDTATCGGPHNVRMFRERRRAAAGRVGSSRRLGSLEQP